MNTIRVLVVDDSITVRKRIVAVLSADPDVVVVGEAENGKQAVEMCRDLRPSVITLDMVLQEINRYADSEFRYTDKSDDAAVTDIIRRERQREKAVREIEAMKGEGRW